MSQKISLDKLISFQTRKSIHVNLTRDAHAGLKIACIKRGLSFQEVFDEISQLIAADNSDMIAILDDLAINKRNKVIRQFSGADSESILDIIKMSNPFSSQD